MLQDLKKYTSETLKKSLHELDVYFLFHYKFDICFQFFHASSIYSETKQIPERVFNILRIENEELNPKDIQEYMKYISEVTQKCLADIIADALNYLNIWCPSLFISSQENDDTLSSQCNSAVLRTKESKNSSNSKKVRFQFNSENFISNKENSGITAPPNIGHKGVTSKG